MFEEEFDEGVASTESLKAQADQAGLGTLAVFMAAAYFGPKAARGLARKAIQTVGGQAARSQSFLKQARSQLQRSRDVEAGVQSRIRETARLGDRAARAAAYEAEQGSVQFSRFMKNMGAPGPSRLKARADRWESFRSNHDTKTDRIKALVKSPAQRRVVGDLASKIALQQAVEMPVMYAIDSYTGVMGEPDEAPGFLNVPGHAANFVTWLPQYAAFEAIGRGALHLPKLAAEQTRHARGLLKDQPALGAAMGRAYETALDQMEEIRSAATTTRHVYNRTMKSASARKADSIAAGGRAFYKELKSLRQRRRSLTPQERALRRMATSVASDPGLRSVDRLVGGNRWMSLHENTLRKYDTKADPKGLYKELFRPGFVQKGETEASGGLGRLFGGSPVTLGDMEKQLQRAAHGVSEKSPAMSALRDAQSRIQRVRQGVESLRGVSGETPRSVEAFVRSNIKAENVRLAGFAKSGGRTFRAPLGSEIRQKVGHALSRGTTLARRFTISNLFQTHTLTSTRPDVEAIRGKFTVDTNAFFFGDAKRSGSIEGDRLFEHGFYVADQPGATRGSIYGFRGGRLHEVAKNKALLSAAGNSKLHEVAMRLSGARAEAEPSIDYQLKRRRYSGPLAKTLERLQIASGQHRSGYSMLRDAAGRLSPRRLLKKGSPFYGHSGESRLQRAGIDVAQAVSTARQAFIGSTDVYTRRDVFSQVTHRLGWSRKKLAEFGGVEGILSDDRQAFRAAKDLIESLPARFDKLPSVAPSAANARRIVTQVEREGYDALYNASGMARGQTLRRFLFEQSVLGPGGGLVGARESLRGVDQTLANLAQKGTISRGVAAEARMGLLSLRLRAETGEAYKQPFKELTKTMGGRLSDTKLGRALGVFQQDDIRPVLEEFAASRPVVDLKYHSRALREADEFATNAFEADVMAVTPSLKQAIPLWMSYALDTTREAFGFLGLGWEGSAKSLADTGMSGWLRAEMGAELWKQRAGYLIGGVLAYRAADTVLDMVVPDALPLGDGLTSSLASAAAAARVGSAGVYDALGVTDAAGYMEGLMPKSSTMLPGGAAGLALGRSAKGAVIGATLNRIVSEATTDTPLEALSAIPGVNFFIGDPAQSAEKVRAIYEGEEWVPVRKGRGFLLSTSDFAGGRVKQFRPNWYTRTRADIGSTDVLYGSDFAEALFKPLPLVDFAPGDLFDPQYLQRRHMHDRPYAAPRIPFSEMPFVGPLVGQTFGRAYLALHPMGSNRPLHMENVVGQFEGEGSPGTTRPLVGDSAARALVPTGFGGFGAVGALEGMPGETAVMGSSTRAVYDEQFYRVAEAMGFQGFMLQQIVGGEGIFRNPIYPSAAEMSSLARSFHDENLGDMLGIGEALRRMYPFVRNAERLGPGNTMPLWMGEDFRTGDPYCLHPATKIEIDGHLIPAEEAYARITNGEKLHARTHTGKIAPIVSSAVRAVDEEIVRIEVVGLPWPLEVTAGHPILVERGDAAVWKRAGELTEADRVLLPAGPEHVELALKDYEIGKAEGYRWRLPHGGKTTRGLLALPEVEPPRHQRYSTAGLSEEDEFALEEAFGLSGAKSPYRVQATLCELRREMAERGLPLSIIGSTGQALLPLVTEWGEMSERDIRINLTTGRIGRRGREHWRAYKPYEPEREALSALHDAGYTLFRAFLSAGVPGELRASHWGFQLRLTGVSAKRFVYSERERKNRQDYQFAGERRIKMVRLKTDRVRSSFGSAPISRIERKPYEGPVYAFEVDGDSSFVACGVATHNSKIMNGEALLPGEGYESVVNAQVGTELDVSDIGADPYETSLRMLDIIEEGMSQQGSWARESVLGMLRDVGYAARQNAVFVDPESRIAATADAATHGHQPIFLEALSDAEYWQGEHRGLDVERANAALGVAKRSRGAIVYVNEDTGEVRSQLVKFDSGLYNKSLKKLQEGRSLALRYAAEGYGAPGAMYSAVDRLQVLLNADPFGSSFKTEMKKAEKYAEAGAFTGEEARRFRTIKNQREIMSLPFEVFPDRFSMTQLTDPDHQTMMLNFNEHVKAASEYTLAERAVGSAWETFANLRSPLHSKFFGSYNLENTYRNRVLLGRDFQDWGHPVRDFALPYARGLAAADNPVQGAVSYATGAALFLGGPWTMLAGTAGAVYGAAHGAYRSATGTEYIPESVESLRGAEQAFDRIRYYRAQALYEATGSAQFQRERDQTAYGFWRRGLSEGGFGQRYRKENGPYAKGGSDRGFASPYGGQDPERALGYDAQNPYPQHVILPPSVLGAFRAAPGSERSFLKAALAIQGPAQQESFLRLVSPDMAAVLDQSWSEMYGSPGRGFEMDGMGHLDLPAHHPAMGLGADMEGYQIRTMEDLRLDAHDSGIGWKDALLRMDAALSQPSSLASELRGTNTATAAPSAQELRAIIRQGLSQMGLVVDVEVSEANGPTEIQIHQSL